MSTVFYNSGVGTAPIPGSGAVPKRRKHQRACDLCKRRKVLCDASEMPDNRCSRCISSGIECIYDPNAKVRRTTQKYIEELESRLYGVENLLKKLYTGLGTQLPESTDDSDADDQPQNHSKSLYASSYSPASSSVAPRAPHISSEPESLDSSECESDSAVGNPIGYHGESSNKSLIKTVIDLKNKYSRRPVELCHKRNGSDRLTQPIVRTPYRHFPTPNELEVLIDEYFKNVNVYVPLLHRQTFENSLKDGLHLRDESFGAVVLLVSAIGSGWSGGRPVAFGDQRKVPGFQWFDQVVSAPWLPWARPQLYDLQAGALAAIYLNGHSPENCWSILGLSIRMALDVGAHRKRMYSPTPTVEQELWKRAFWVLVVLDWTASFALGRPCAMNEEDFDVDLVIECDDEYWIGSDPTQAFKQPEGTPSKVAFFNCMVRLLKIKAFASRTIYTINKSKLLFGFVGSEWKQRIVAELDSALNRWKDTVPAHLRWDPNREDDLFFVQSATLYTSFYQLQIFVHRQFIPSPRRSAHSLPSLTICTSAARSCVRVFDVQCRRMGLRYSALNAVELPLVTACLVLLLNLWAGGRSERETKEIRGDVERCLEILKESEPTNTAALKVRAILNALISAAGDSSSGPQSESRYNAKSGVHDLDSLVITAMENIRISLSDPEATTAASDERLRGFLCKELSCTVHWNSDTGGDGALNGNNRTCPFASVDVSTPLTLSSAQSQPGQSPRVGPDAPRAANSTSTWSPTLAAYPPPPGFDNSPSSWPFDFSDMVGGASAQDLRSHPPDLASRTNTNPSTSPGSDPQMQMDISQWFMDTGPLQDGALWSLWPTGGAGADEWDMLMERIGGAESTGPDAL